MVTLLEKSEGQIWAQRASPNLDDMFNESLLSRNSDVNSSSGASEENDAQSTLCIVRDEYLTVN